MQLHSLLIPVDDLTTAISAMTETLGCRLQFRDGDRYAALKSGDLLLNLVAREERIVDEAALVVRVDDMDAAIATFRTLGGEVISPPIAGPHEVRAVLHGPAGLLLVLTAKLAAAA